MQYKPVEKRLKRVFLGGTCAGSTWREYMKSKLDIGFYDPVVDDWNEEAQAEEIRQRTHCDFCLYVVTPKMQGAFSIAEVVDDSNKRPEKTIFCHIAVDENVRFSEAQTKSLIQVGAMVRENGGQVFSNLVSTLEYLNQQGN